MQAIVVVVIWAVVLIGIPMAVWRATGRFEARERERRRWPVPPPAFRPSSWGHDVGHPVGDRHHPASRRRGLTRERVRPSRARR
jgi:hypothetical protein